MKAVISLGGSLVTNPFTADNIAKYVKILNELKKKCGTLVVVVGGGKPAREYQQVARELGMQDKHLDQIGTYITHANALMLAHALGANDSILRTDEDLAKQLGKHDVFLCGGTKPGQS